MNTLSGSNGLGSLNRCFYNVRCLLNSDLPEWIVNTLFSSSGLRSLKVIAALRCVTSACVLMFHWRYCRMCTDVLLLLLVYRCFIGVTAACVHMFRYCR